MPLLGRHKSLQSPTGSKSRSPSPTPTPPPLVCESPLFGTRRQLPVASQQAPATATAATEQRPLASSVSLTHNLSGAGSRRSPGGGGGPPAESTASRGAARRKSAALRDEFEARALAERGRQLADQLETLSSIPKQITRQQIHYAFSIMDTNQDGLIDLRDLSQMLANLGVPIDEAILSHVFLSRKVSKRGDHLINESEFLDWIGNFIQVSDLLVAPPASSARAKTPVARSSSASAAAAAAAASLAAHSPEAQAAIEHQLRHRRGSGSGLALMRSLSSSSETKTADEKSAQSAPKSETTPLEQLEQVQEARNDLKAAFCVFDLDGDGFITIDEVQQGLKLLGESWSQQELNSVFSKCDSASTGSKSDTTSKKSAAKQQQQQQQQKSAQEASKQRISIDDFVKLLL